MALTLTQLQDYINTNVKANGRKAITGDIMNYLMLQFVDWVDTYSALPDKGGHNSEFLRVNSAGTALEWAAVQAPLVSGTNIKTINGTSLLGSGDISVSASPGGSSGQVQFNASGSFGGDSSFVWDNTNKRLGIGATPSTSVRLDVRAQGALSSDIAFRVRNSADTSNLVQFQGNGENKFITQNTTLNNYALKVENTSGTMLMGYNNYGFFHIQNATNPSTNYILLAPGNSASEGDLSIYNSSGPIIALRGSSVAKLSCFSSLALVLGYTGLTEPAIGIWKAGNFSFCTPSDAAAIQSYSGTNVLNIASGTAPTSSITDAFRFYSADIVAGNAAPHFRTEAGDIIKLYKQSASGVSTVADVVTVLTNLGLLA